MGQLQLATGKLLIAGVNTDRQVGVQNNDANWAPRFGFAYQVRSNTVIRGGFGHLLQHPGQWIRVVPSAPAASVRTRVTWPRSISSPPRRQRVQDGLPPIPNVDINTLIYNPVGNFNSVPPNYKNGYAQQFNFGVEQELPSWSTVLKASYVDNLARQVDSTSTSTRPTPARHARFTPTAAQHRCRGW